MRRNFRLFDNASGQNAEKGSRKLLWGIVFPGLGQGAYFTQLDWVKEQCTHKLGFIPYPGTLNLRVAGQYRKVLHRLRNRPGMLLEPPEAQFCQGVCYPVLVGNVAAAIIIPLVENYPEDIIEIIATVNIKDTLGLSDGDMLAVKLVWKPITGLV